MKKILNEYKEQIKYFISDKRYIITVLIVSILSYGFTMTHYSIGIDDICFNRYVQGTYILSAKRWGTWALYNLLQINEFSPFWLDAVVTMIMIVIAITLCAFIRRQYGDKIKIWGYVIFSSLFISNPLINHFFIYQSTNLAIVISNLLVIICAITIFENYFYEDKKIINIICGVFLMLPISMYESCAQTYIVILFITIFVKLTHNKEENKKIFKYFLLSISMLVLGIILYFAVGKILIFVLDKLNLLKTNFAYSNSLWLDTDFKVLSLKFKLMFVYEIVIKMYSVGWKYLQVIIFWGFSFIVIIIEFIKSIKTRKFLRLICVFGTILSNYILMFVLLAVLFRMQFSWIVTTAFLGLYIYQALSHKRFIKYIIAIVLALIIVIQTRTLNQYFYNDYKRYEHDKIMANDIALNVMKSCDYKNKPILCIVDRDKGYKYAKNIDNSTSVIAWGVFAFQEYQTEITKFINEQGYNFIYITKEQAEKAYADYHKLDENTKNEYIIELEDVIIVNLNIYDF